VTFTSESSPLNQKNGKHNTQASNFDATTKPLSLRRSQVNSSVLQLDLAERKPISCYHPNENDELRRAYIQKGPYQPRNHSFKKLLLFDDSSRIIALIVLAL